MERNKVVLLDGGMGTMLQKHGADTGRFPEVLNITDPEMIIKIHREYVEAGSDIIYTNTFGCGRCKREGCGYPVSELTDAAVKNARIACGRDPDVQDAKEGAEIKVAVSIGPLGQMLEPAGIMKFEEAYEIFKEIAVQAELSGADLIVIETMTDLYEMKAAVLACRENTSLDIMASMSFEESGRTFTGCSIETIAATLEGLGVSKIGINCSLGPVQVLPLAQRLNDATSLPIFIKPNAGLPDPLTGEYNITPEEFADAMEKYLEIGVDSIGGCCGTDPEYIRCLAQMIERRGAAAEAERECKKQKTANSLNDKGF